jgi:hypothetical protein
MVPIRSADQGIVLWFTGPTGRLANRRTSPYNGIIACHYSGRGRLEDASRFRPEIGGRHVAATRALHDQHLAGSAAR